MPRVGPVTYATELLAAIRSVGRFDDVPRRRIPKKNTAGTNVGFAWTKDQAVHAAPQSEMIGNGWRHYFVALNSQIVGWNSTPQIESGAQLVTEHSMDSKSRIYALEVMHREVNSGHA